EDLRKPYVLGQQLFVNGVRVARPPGAPTPPAATVGAFGEDPFTMTALQRDGVLKAARYSRLPEPSPDPVVQMEAEGREVFRLVCSSCHTTDGYLAIRPLAQGKSAEALDKVIASLASPMDSAGEPTTWDLAPAHLRSWRGRRMPPFPGTGEERLALAFYLARVGGAPATLPAAEAPAGGGAHAYFEENCSPCHGSGADFQIGGRGRTSAEVYEMLGRLPEINEMMPPFEGSDELRKELAEYLVGK
ncbi:MAG TPA: c-type cytochrome, partial [Vicinamibacterales bacterium]|nr:c-type cytochrome [Vicinamibacterales bacterium]